VSDLSSKQKHRADLEAILEALKSPESNLSHTDRVAGMLATLDVETEDADHEESALVRAFMDKITGESWSKEWRSERLIEFVSRNWGDINMRRFCPGDGSVEIRLGVHLGFTCGHALRHRHAAELAEALTEAARLAAALQKEYEAAICERCGRHLYDPGKTHAEGCPDDKEVHYRELERLRREHVDRVIVEVRESRARRCAGERRAEQ
jgi:hypothetical protein